MAATRSATVNIRRSREVKRPSAEVSDELLGTAIRRLRQATKTVRKSGRYGYSYRRIFTDQQIMTMMNISRSRFNAVLDSTKPAVWDKNAVWKRFEAFVKKNGRWPRRVDHRDKANGLPSVESCNRWWGTPSGRGSWWRTTYSGGVDALVAEYCTKHESKLTPQLALSIPNLTRRRDFIERIGIEKLVRDAGTKIQEDDFGVLWRLPTDGVDRHMQYIEVENKSPRVDESGKTVLRRGKPVFDHYFLRVPPTVTTAQAGVAWGLELDPALFKGYDQES